VAQIGGRSRVAAWIVGVLCAAVVVGLIVISVPMVPVVGDWVNSLLPN